MVTCGSNLVAVADSSSQAIIPHNILASFTTFINGVSVEAKELDPCDYDSMLAVLIEKSKTAGFKIRRHASQRAVERQISFEEIESIYFNGVEYIDPQDSSKIIKRIEGKGTIIIAKSENLIFFDNLSNI